ncbi:hypothetical protein WJX84_002840 [Apatococcus fuscideae]|uniref:Protein kinase domain-containing protein n=1 Tax=Apatococcus fuscideae TaxID=2026836 RepID=A0AAW1T5T9_9CHLO
MHDLHLMHCGSVSVLCSGPRRVIQPNSGQLSGRSLARKAALSQPAVRDSTCHHRCPLRATATGPGPDDSSDEHSGPVDIDQLAQQLAREAARLNSPDPPKDTVYERPPSLEDTAASSQPADTDTQHDSRTGPFGDESLEREAQILYQVGDGGFSSSEFELLTELGRLSYVTEVQSDDPFKLRPETSQQRTAVIAFGARFFSGKPFQGPATVLLKEYLPGARAIGCNELQIMHHLSGMPLRKWHAATSRDASEAPLTTLLGYFIAGSSDSAAAIESRDGAAEDHALWLVYKFETMQPLSNYTAAPQQSSNSLFWQASGNQALKLRCRMVRAIARGALEALAFCHDQGVAHGSLGPGSILLSTLDDREAQQLSVKLDNFGFARRLQAPVSGTSDGKGSLAGPSDKAAATDGALQRLWLEVFKCDAREFRRYCSQEPAFAEPMLFLDEFGNAGWQLLSAMTNGGGKFSALDLLANPLLDLG